MTIAYPFALEPLAARLGVIGKEVLVKARLLDGGEAVTRGDGDQVHALLVHGVGQQLPVVVHTLSWTVH